MRERGRGADALKESVQPMPVGVIEQAGVEFGVDASQARDGRVLHPAVLAIGRRGPGRDLPQRGKNGLHG
ncbi:hypothetical protein GCM10022255_069780 [Dactylosporangium darangshiense]|uniref:Uncharacterized protein n=1 Tax=Dactylosporangium darangshiense TaxID=579108 RepID=A0ABP8DI56_9ACTN